MKTSPSLHMPAYNRQPGSLGYVYVILAAALWGTSGTVSKFLFQGGVTPNELVQLRTTISSVTLFMLLLRRPSLLRIDPKDSFSFVLLGVLLAAAQFTYLYAISKIQVAAAILLQYQAPVLIAAYSVLFARKRLTHSTTLALSGATIGCYLMVGAYNVDVLSMNSAGILSGLASAVAFASYSVRSDKGMQTYSPWTVVFYALLFSAVIWNSFHPPLQAFDHSYSVTAWLCILFVGVFGTLLPFGLYNVGISMIQPTRASITATLEPVTAGIIAYLFLGEVMEPWQLMGAALVIASVLLLRIKIDPKPGGRSAG